VYTSPLLDAAAKYWPLDDETTLNSPVALACSIDHASPPKA
jgi:hypothetical protein